MKDGPASAPSHLNDLLADGVPPWEAFLPAMLAEFPGQTEEHWAGVWDDAKRIEKEKAHAAADPGNAVGER